MRRSIPTETIMEPATPDARHKAGMSCKTPAAYIFDANGYRRWCMDCRAPLGLAGDPQASRFSALMLVPFAIGLLVAVLLLFAINATLVAPTGTPVTPTTYGHPPVVHSGP